MRTRHGRRFLEPVTAAICQLARELDKHGVPVDYARRRRLRRFAQARLDTAAWHRQRHLLAIPPAKLASRWSTITQITRAPTRSSG